MPSILHSGRAAIAFLCVISVGLSAGAQLSPEEHASHHPDANSVTPTAKSLAGREAKPDAMSGMDGASMPPASASKKTSGMAEMGAMMQGMMGGQPQKELYPSLMALPNLSPQQRLQFQQQAEGRGKMGTALLQQGTARIANPDANDLERQEGAANVRVGLKEWESGQAARRALAEGRSPRAVALQWFQSEMNLQPQPNRGLLALPWFHILVIAILATFLLVMLGMYFFKMRRAAALLERLTNPVDGAVPVAEPLTADVKVQPPAVDKGAMSGVPIVQPGKLSGKLRLSQIFHETPNVKTFRLMDALGGEIPFVFQPGQYLTVTVLPEGKPVKRSYTIASSPSEHAYVDLTIKREEKGIESRYLHDRVQVGDIFDFAGPFGSFVFTGHECKCIVLIGGGVGITPMMSVLRYLMARSWPGDIFLLYGCKTPHDIIFREELDYLQKRHSNLHVVVTVSDAAGTDWKGATGLITKELILQSVPDIKTRRVHICGPKAMMEATEKFLDELGVPKEQVKTEAFGPAIGKQESEFKPIDSIPATSAVAETTESATTASTHQVTFSKSAKPAPIPPNKTVLEASEDIGVNIPFECRVGTCGVCKVKLVSGTVTMAIEDALEPGEKASGIILACQAKATSNLVVEA